MGPFNNLVSFLTQWLEIFLLGMYLQNNSYTYTDMLENLNCSFSFRHLNELFL